MSARGQQQSKQEKKPSREERRMRRQQIIFGVIGILVILSWVIALVATQ